MKKILFCVALASIIGPSALAQSTVYVSPDVPTPDPGGSSSVFFPWEVVAYQGGAYAPSPVVSLPPNVAIDAVHKLDAPGQWLLSVAAASELPPASGTFYQPEDVFLHDGGSYTLVFDGSAEGVPAGSNVDAIFREAGDSSPLVLSFNVPTTIATVTYDPSDLVRFAGGSYSLFFDASASGAGVALSDNAMGADACAGEAVLSMSVPSDLLPSSDPVPYLPGQIVSWDGLDYSLLEGLSVWPISSRVDGFSCEANPGLVPATLMVDESALTVGDLTLTWTPSCSSGAQDYGIYEGDLANLPSYDHVLIDCGDDGGDFTEEITPSPGDRYYLIVPNNGAVEGSYGKARFPDGSLVEIPQAAAPGDRCKVDQVITACP